ncbi:subclass B3 metallo-beta-lactamase [Stenotrophomonas mori]|uniref:beta-lactamase n=1 Tax=Stenotrophomonas mori TaxID=2871096 RepID=A0ABT0SEP8_9GAMM|nr:subclass B3 metallo-beta-lactamase [Stenotrophomonas mori]MCL7713601.1 subclass B3 metallo-beta-lactamase [Stenotrophomonas mori]
MRRATAAAALLLALSFLPGCHGPRAAGPPAAAGPTGTPPAYPATAGIMEGWDTPAPPRRLFGTTWYVGTCGITALLVTSPQGHILIDGGTPAAGAAIAANIQALGFRLGDIRVLLNSHEHADHAGGLAYLQRASGAPLLARAPAMDALRRGTSAPGDPQSGVLERFPAIADVRPLADGQVVRVGETAVTAHAAPGHAPGGTSWTWTACEARTCLRMAYVDSLSAATDADYRFSDHPGYLAAFRRSLDRTAALPCDVLLSPHPLAVDLPARLAGQAPLAEAGACSRHSALARRALDQRLRAETGGAGR